MNDHASFGIENGSNVKSQEHFWKVNSSFPGGLAKTLQCLLTVKPHCRSDLKNLYNVIDSWCKHFKRFGNYSNISTALIKRHL